MKRANAASDEPLEQQLESEPEELSDAEKLLDEEDEDDDEDEEEEDSPRAACPARSSFPAHAL